MQLNHIKIVLVNPTHPGNIGATARAMKNMGLQQLVLVSPAYFPHADATARASGADDILAQAVVVDDLLSAIANCEQVYGTSARFRHLSWPMVMPRDCAQELTTAGFQSVAIVFGRENSGLTNDELALCQKHIHIPTEPSFSSLNLAAAVQLIVYELRMALMQRSESPIEEGDAEPSTAAEMEGFYNHLWEKMISTDFMESDRNATLKRRLRRLFNRAAPDKTELNILRGFLSSIKK